MGIMAAMFALTRATYLGVVTRPLYYVTLLVFSAAILVSRAWTLFAFGQEAQMMREMGVATMTLWGVLVVAAMSGILVSNELEDKTALLLLSKPLKRSHFLLGKYLGVLWAQALGILFLTLMFFLTLWFLDGQKYLDRYSISLGPSVWPFLWRHFLSPLSEFVAQAALLCFFQVSILSAFCICMAAFVPIVVTISSTATLFILGNVSSHLVSNLENSPGFIYGLARFASYLLPNLGYFNLQVHFSEGATVSAIYLLLLTLYTIIYASSILVFASMVFESREIR